MKKDSKSLSYLEGTLSIIINIILAVLKYWVGVATHSVAIIADAWHTLSDSLSSIVLIIGAKATSKPADERHPFGHGRAELVASMVIGVFLAMIGFNFLSESISKLFKHETSTFSMTAVIVFILSVIFKEAIALFSFWAGKVSGSQALKADGWHHRSDAIASLLILIGLFMGKYFWWMDGVLGILVSLLIFLVTYEILKSSISPLLGEKAPDDVTAQIDEIIAVTTNEPVDAHHFHFHNYGHHREITFHITLDGQLTLERVHAVADDIEKALREKMNLEATIHVEPRESGQ